MFNGTHLFLVPTSEDRTHVLSGHPASYCCLSLNPKFPNPNYNKIPNPFTKMGVSILASIAKTGSIVILTLFPD